MLELFERAANTEALFNAVIHIGGHRLGRSVVYATAPVSVKFNGRKLVDREPLSIRFTHDKNAPKVAMDSLETYNFHTEFSVLWVHFQFVDAKKQLVIKGSSSRFSDYVVCLHLRDTEATLEA